MACSQGANETIMYLLHNEAIRDINAKTKVWFFFIHSFFRMEKMLYYWALRVIALRILYWSYWQVEQIFKHKLLFVLSLCSYRYRIIVTCWWSVPSLVEQSYSISFIAFPISMWMWRMLYFFSSIYLFIYLSIHLFIYSSIYSPNSSNFSNSSFYYSFFTTLTTRMTTAVSTTLVKAAISTSSSHFSTAGHLFASATRKKNTPKISLMQTTTMNASTFSKLSLLLHRNLKSIMYS